MTELLTPVFVFPHSLEFYMADQTKHKRVLTIYNPHDFIVRFKVYCSSKDKYTVVDPKRMISPAHRVDVLIRHNAITEENFGQVDKFRIELYEYCSNKLMGRRDITAKLLPEEPKRQFPARETPEEESFYQIPVDKQLTTSSGKQLTTSSDKQLTTSSDKQLTTTSEKQLTTSGDQPSAQHSLSKRPVRTSPPNSFYITIAVICISTLLLPTTGEISTIVPEYLKPSIHLKLVVSYVLGLVTIVLLKLV